MSVEQEFTDYWCKRQNIESIRHEVLHLVTTGQCLDDDDSWVLSEFKTWKDAKTAYTRRPAVSVVGAEEALDKIEKAWTELQELCNGKRFTMQIPARPGIDSDLVIADGLSAAKKAIASLTAQAPVNGVPSRLEIMQALERARSNGGNTLSVMTDAMVELLTTAQAPVNGVDDRLEKAVAEIKRYAHPKKDDPLGWPESIFEPVLRKWWETRDKDDAEYNLRNLDDLLRDLVRPLLTAQTLGSGVVPVCCATCLHKGKTASDDGRA